MKLNCYYTIWGHDDYLTSHCHKAIVDALEEANPSIEFNRVDNRSFNAHANDKYGYHSLIIENDATKKYLVVTYMDKCHYMKVQDKGWDLENCEAIYASSGYHQQDFFYEPYEGLELTPFTYSIATRSMQDAIDECHSIKPTMPPKPPFRGKLYNFRNYIVNDDRFNVQGEFRSPKDYAFEMAANTMNMSLNGAGEICQRDLEVLAMGTTLFRETLCAQFHNPLIPNYHYIAIDCEPIKKTIRDEFEYYEAQCEVYMDRWNEVKDDTKLLEEVAKNGKEWYEANGRPKQHGEVALQAIDLTKVLHL